MKAAEALKELEELGTEKVRTQNQKHGSGKKQFGVKLGDIRKVAKKIKTDHGLALELWKTKNVEAQFLATLVIRPKELSAMEMDRMVRTAVWDRVADWLNSYVVKHHPDLEELRQAWMEDEDPMALRAGLNWTGSRMAKSPEGLDVPGLLDRTEAEILDAHPNAQWTMNTCLTYIGIHLPKHRKRALAIGEKLGLYRDYPVSTGCTSPFAPIAIKELVSRQG